MSSRSQHLGWDAQAFLDTDPPWGQKGGGSSDHRDITGGSLGPHEQLCTWATALRPVTHNISESVLYLGKKLPVNTRLIYNILIADDFNCVVFKCLQIITPSQPPARFCSEWCVHYCHLTSVWPCANFTVHGHRGVEMRWLSSMRAQHNTEILFLRCKQNAVHGAPCW